MRTKPSILLIEDNPGDIRLLRELLAEAGEPFRLTEAHTLAEALERLEMESFHSILLDLTLPDSRGIETFRRIARHAPQTPLIVLSGLSDRALALQTVQEGAQDYLVKGAFEHETVVRAIHYALKRVEAERVLAQERALLRSVIDNLLDAIYVKDAQGRYLLDNVAHRRLLGVSDPAEVLMKSVYDFFPEAVARRFDEDDRHVLETGEPIVNREGRFAADPSGRRWISVTIVPLRNDHGGIAGVVGIVREITERKKAQAQLELYHHEIRARNAELEDDLNMAREIQQAFLPHQFPSFPFHAAPHESALHFHSRYIPTAAVGGDFFHILPISDTKAGVFICDVMGHGVRAALVTAMQRALVEELLPLAHDPGRFMTEINRVLITILRRVRTPMFASAFYLVVDTGEGVLRYASAGHPSPLHFHHEQGEWVFLSPERPGPALGVFPETFYQTRSCSVAVHDLVVLFTDGLYEVENPQGEYFDQQRLLEIFEHHGDAPVEELIEETLAEVRAFGRQHDFLDDVCVIAVEIDRIEADQVSRHGR